MSAVTTMCESRTVSGSKSICVDFVVGKLMAEENLYDKARMRSAPMSSCQPFSQTKVGVLRLFCLIFGMYIVL